MEVVYFGMDMRGPKGIPALWDPGGMAGVVFKPHLILWRQRGWPCSQVPFSLCIPTPMSNADWHTSALESQDLL